MSLHTCYPLKKIKAKKKKKERKWSFNKRHLEQVKRSKEILLLTGSQRKYERKEGSHIPAHSMDEDGSLELIPRCSHGSH